MARIAYVEPFEGGSHAAFGRSLREGLAQHQWTEFTLPARHWKWRMRGSAVHFASDPRWDAGFDLLFAASYLPLAELLALRPELSTIPRVLYFHENQLEYPMRPEFSGERDLHYGFTQLVSALAANACWFNSAWNRDSFLDAGRRLLASMPDARCPDWIDRIEARSRIMPLPLELPDLPFRDGAEREDAPPLIVWNHRWEYDKGPDVFFRGLDSLLEAGVEFRVAVVGQRFAKVPKCFAQARERLEAHPLAHIEQWGYLESREAYWQLLARADLAVSTAEHEFFGISMMEAAHAGARLLVPDALAYRELFPGSCRYAVGEFGASLLGAMDVSPVAGDTENLAGSARGFAATRVLELYRDGIEGLLV